MAVPKENIHLKKKNEKITPCLMVNIVEDKKSGEYKSHHVDLKTGFYNGKKILDI